MKRSYRDEDGNLYFPTVDYYGNVSFVKIPAGPKADGMRDAESKFISSDIRFDRLIHKGVESLKSIAHDENREADGEDYVMDPIDQLPDERVDIEADVIGEDKPAEPREYAEVRRLKAELKPKKRDAIEKHFGQNLTYEAIGKSGEKKVTKAAVKKRVDTGLEEIRTGLAEVGITDEYFNTHRRD